jgi:lysophospholipase L1-like esterase
VRDDFDDDGTHPSQSGEQKVGAMLLEFLKTSAETRCRFLAGEAC